MWEGGGGAHHITQSVKFCTAFVLLHPHNLSQSLPSIMYHTFFFHPTYIPCLVGLLGYGWMFFSSMKSAFQCCAELFRAVYCFSSDLTSVQWRSVVCTMLLIKCSGLDLYAIWQWNAMKCDAFQRRPILGVEWLFVLSGCSAMRYHACSAMSFSAFQCSALHSTAVAFHVIWLQ